MNSDIYVKAVTGIAGLLVISTYGFNLYILLKESVMNSRKAYAAGCFYTALVIILNFLPQVTGRTVIYGAPLFIIWWFLCLERKNKIRQNLFLCLTFFTLRNLSAGLATEMSFFVNNYVYSTKTMKSNINALLIYYTIEQIVAITLIFVILFLMIVCVKKVYQSKSEEMNIWELGILFVPQAAMMFVNIIINKYYKLFMKGIKEGIIKRNIPADIYRVLFYIFSYLVLLGVIMFYEKTKELRDEVQQRQILNQQLNDVKNHITQMEEMFANTSEEEARQYMNRLKEEFQEADSVIRTGNAVTDIILSEKCKQADKLGIQLECRFSYPENTDIDVFDMSVLLNNALDNCLESTGGKNPYINIQSNIQGDIFMLIITNTFNGTLLFDKKTELPITTKNGDLHGLGLSSIQRIAKKYGGDISLEQENGKIILSVILQSHKS